MIWAGLHRHRHSSTTGRPWVGQVDGGEGAGLGARGEGPLGGDLLNRHIFPHARRPLPLEVREVLSLLLCGLFGAFSLHVW